MQTYLCRHLQQREPSVLHMQAAESSAQMCTALTMMRAMLLAINSVQLG
jgi:hypothetical protein